MPQDRFLHPRLGHSEKVTLLTDFEFRVWTQYILSADDFGVMRASAVTLQSDNDALHAKKASIVQRALEHLLTVHLVDVFEHQGRQYVYQPNWQAYQKIEWPRSTIQPAPSGADLAKCDEATMALFGKHPGGLQRKKPKQLPSDSESASQMNPEPSPSLAGALARETAQAKAHGSVLLERESEEKPPVADLTDRAGRLREELYPEWYAKYRHGARLRIVANSLEFQDAMSLVTTWDDARLEKLARIVLTTDDEFITGTDRSFHIFAIKASWADDRLRQAENGTRR